MLNQTFHAFDYFVVDNCSTDESREIAQAAAARDDRVKLVTNAEHVGLIQNWNRSLQSVTAEHDYTKFVHADDWLFSQCIDRMVDVFDANPTVGIVSSYRLEEDRVSLDKLPSAAPNLPGDDVFTMPGKAVVSAILGERASVLGSPTAYMLRTSIMGEPSALFATKYLHADKESCLRLLQETDFGFVRQVLSFTRRHNESVTSLTNSLDTRRQENLLFLEKFGPANLSDGEFRRCRSNTISAYYRFLATKIGTGQEDAFWRSHEELLDQVGSPLNRLRLAMAYAKRWLNPGKAIRETIDQTRIRKQALKASKAREFLQANRASLDASNKQRESA